MSDRDTLLPIGPDGDTGTRAIVEPAIDTDTRPSIAELIQIDQEARTVLIDGRPFPWLLAEGGPRVEDDFDRPDSLTIVHLPILADSVQQRGGVRPPTREITTAAEADALPVGTILVHLGCPDPDPCIWLRVCKPSEVEDETDGGTFDHIHWTVWADEETRYDSEDLECHLNDGESLTVLHAGADG